MRIETIERKLYKFEELSDEAKGKALEGLYDINVDHEWWGMTYDDAKNIGLKITEFDINRGSYVRGKFILSAHEVAIKIISDHGPDCETRKTAENFLEKYDPIFAAYMDEGSEKYESRETEDELMELEEEFLESLCEDYRIILRNEYEYLTSEKAIKETIDANEYEFTENGKLA